MSTSACVSENTDQMQPKIPNSTDEIDSGMELTDTKDSKIEEQTLRNPMDEIDTEGEEGDSESANAEVEFVSTSVTSDSGQESSTLQSCSDSTSENTQELQEHSIIEEVAAVVHAAVRNTDVNGVQSSSKGTDVRNNQNGAKAKSGKDAAKEDKKEEKKKSKKKEDKSVEYILRALNSLQSPEEKLAALCKKYADLHEEHRVLQNSFKTQQRTLTVVAREKDQLQSEHTKAMIAKSKLESLCRELQKHNKIIKDESIKRAKEDDEKRKEISAQFNVTIGEIQSQMSDNSEKNNRLRKENDNLAEQLRAFISQCQGREEHVKKLQEHHDLEKKLASAKLAQAEAILKEVEERGNKEKELMLFKLTEITKKSQITETQLELYKSKYDEFNDLHTRSSETFQKYKTEMDKMTKRIKKLEKDGLQWKAKWESTSKALVEQYEARSKSEQETTVYAQKMKRLESLCRALQAELHGKKVVHKESDEGEDAAKPNNLSKESSPSSPAILVKSPDASSPDQPSPEQISSTETASSSSHEPSASSSSQSSSDSSPASSPESQDAAVKAAADTDQSCPEETSEANSCSTDIDSNSSANTDRNNDVAPSPMTQTLSESRSEDEPEKHEVEASIVEVTQ